MIMVDMTLSHLSRKGNLAGVGHVTPFIPLRRRLPRRHKSPRQRGDFQRFFFFVYIIFLIILCSNWVLIHHHHHHTARERRVRPIITPPPHQHENTASPACQHPRRPSNVKTPRYRPAINPNARTPWRTRPSQRGGGEGARQVRPRAAGGWCIHPQL
jgi:hypothetical protein